MKLLDKFYAVRDGDIFWVVCFIIGIAGTLLLGAGILYLLGLLK